MGFTPYFCVMCGREEDNGFYIKSSYSFNGPVIWTHDYYDVFIDDILRTTNTFKKFVILHDEGSVDYSTKSVCDRCLPAKYYADDLIPPRIQTHIHKTTQQIENEKYQMRIKQNLRKDIHNLRSTTNGFNKTDKYLLQTQINLEIEKIINKYKNNHTFIFSKRGEKESERLHNWKIKKSRYLYISAINHTE